MENIKAFNRKVEQRYVTKMFDSPSSKLDGKILQSHFGI